MKPTPEERQRYIDELRASLEEGQRLVRGKGRLVGPILMEAEGVNGRLLLLEDSIRMKQKETTAFLSQGLKSDKIIPFSRISSVQFKGAGILTNGYIHFCLLGECETEGRDANRGENAVIFKAGQQSAFERIKVAIEAKMAMVKTIVPQAAPQAISYIEELEQLASLRDRGIITEEEFINKKRKILGI